ncbi:hypothetical protein [Williamsia soli]|uniref:hypothetical protein n=1 Tax=Williamsia soli TaxID=364929 RepID=UPI001A9E9271|nr:hypothetical protein [Williamsia soli]
MTLTINFKGEGTHTEKVRNLDHGLDRAEILAEEIGMVSRYNRDGTVTLHGKGLEFGGYVA